MQIKYLHEENKPILPAVGDIRILPVLQYNHDPSIETPKVPTGKIRVACCRKLLEHHAVYEFLGENVPLSAIPFELVENYGYTSIDEAIKWILNSFMSDIIENSKKQKYSFTDNVSEYYLKLENLVKLSRQVLKEAEKAKKIYQNFLEKENSKCL